MVRKRGNKPLRKPADEPMTPERRRHAGPDGIATGDDGMGGKRHTILSPLDRLHARHGIAPAAYHALVKFRIHWHNAGLEPSAGSMDLDRIFASDPTNFSGMAKTERQVFHRQQYRNAVQVLGMRSSRMVEQVVCADISLEDAGCELGWRHKVQAISAATEMLRDAGDRLARLWGM